MPTTAQTVHKARSAARGVRRTHKTLTTFVPTVTAALGLLGAIAIALESITGEKNTKAGRTKRKVVVDGAADDAGEDDEENDEEDDEDAASYRGYSPLGHIISFLHHAIKAVALVFFMGAAAFVALFAPPTWTYIILAVLIVASLWLAEIASRRAS